MRVVHREGLTVLLTLFGLLASLTAVAGGRATFLPPDGCLPADGGPAVPIYLYTWDSTPGSPPDVQVSVGQVTRLEDLGTGLYRFQYRPAHSTGDGTLTLSSKTVRATAELPLCADPAGRLEVQVEPSHLLAGAGQKAFLRIKALSPSGEPLAGLPLQLTVNVGRVEQVEDLGGGAYRAVFIPPDDPFPQVGIVMVANPASARMERVSAARVVIPITARVELPGKTGPGTRMQMVVAGRRFGPVDADRSGRFELPILVPPGYGKGQATSIDRAGNRKTRQVDLYLPETNQLGLWAYPLELPADGASRSRLLVTTIDRFGSPADLPGRREGLAIRAERGRVGPLRRLGKGLYEAYYTASAKAGSGQDRIEVQFLGGGSKSRAEVAIGLLPGPPSRTVLEAPDLLAADGRAAGPLTLRIEDASGNPVGRQVVRWSADIGEVRNSGESGPGLHQGALVVAADPLRWISLVRAEVGGTSSAAPDRLLVGTNGLRPTGEGQAELVAVLVDGLGRPVAGGGVDLVCDGGRGQAVTGDHGRALFELPKALGPGPQRCLLSAGQPVVAQQVFWRELGGRPSLLPIGLSQALPPAEPLVAQAMVSLHPPLGVSLSLEAERPLGQNLRWRIVIRATDAAGTPAKGRQIQLSVSAGELSEPEEVQPGVLQASWNPPPAGWQSGLLSAVDVASGIGAVATIREQGAAP